MVVECKSPISRAITNLPSRENTTQTCCTLWRARIALEPPVIQYSIIAKKVTASTFACCSQELSNSVKVNQRRNSINSDHLKAATT